MKKSLQTVRILPKDVKTAQTLPLTSQGPKYYSLVSNYLKLIYIPEGPICLEFALKSFK